MVAVCWSIAGCDGSDRTTAVAPGVVDLDPSAGGPGASGAPPGDGEDAGSLPVGVSVPTDAQAPGQASAPPGKMSRPTFSVGTLPSDVLGYWSSGGDIGDCIDEDEYLVFFADGVAESIRIDNNACYPEDRGTFIIPTTYAVDGRTLTLTTPTESLRSAVAVGEHSGRRLLFQRVFVPIDALHWQAVVESDLLVDDEVHLRRATRVDLFFDATLPASGEAAGSAELHYELTTVDERLPPAERETAATGSQTALTWRVTRDSYEPSLLQLTVTGVPADAFNENLSEVRLRDVGVRAPGFVLSLDPAQPDYLSGTFGADFLREPPPELRR